MGSRTPMRRGRPSRRGGRPSRRGGRPIRRGGRPIPRNRPTSREAAIDYRKSIDDARRLKAEEAASRMSRKEPLPPRDEFNERSNPVDREDRGRKFGEFLAAMKR